MIKVFTKAHVLLDEIDDYSDLKWTKTLNGIGSASFKIGIESTKAIETNLRYYNHLEIYDGTTLVWGGYIVGREFNDSAITVNALGYLGLLKDRRFRAKTYTTQSYGSMVTAMLADVNAVAATGITLGTIASGSANTTRTVTDKDIVLDVLLDLMDDLNYNIEVTDSRTLNFHLRKGKYESTNLLVFGDDNYDNIVLAPTLSQTCLDMGNSIYGELSDGSLDSSSTDSTSITTYGTIERVLTADNTVTDQTTLDNATASELARIKEPLYAITLSVIDTNMFPFSEMEVGDSVPVSLIPYWNFSADLKILEITHDFSNGQRTLTVGSIVYRSAKPSKKLYKGE